MQKEAEAYLPHLVATEGLLLTMADYDTSQSWTFRYRYIKTLLRLLYSKFWLHGLLIHL